MTPLYTEDLATEICERLATGETLAQICRDEHMPAVRTVSDWRKAHADFDTAFLAARDEGFDQIANDCLRIADTPVEGVTEKYEKVLIDNPDDPDGEPVSELKLTERKVEDMLAHRKLQIDTRLKLLAKWDPRRYGDKQTLEHTGPGGGAVEMVTRIEVIGVEPQTE